MPYSLAFASFTPKSVIPAALTVFPVHACPLCTGGQRCAFLKLAGRSAGLLLPTAVSVTLAQHPYSCTRLCPVAHPKPQGLMDSTARRSMFCHFDSSSCKKKQSNFEATQHPTRPHPMPATCGHLQTNLQVFSPSFLLSPRLWFTSASLLRPLETPGHMPRQGGGGEGTHAEATSAHNRRLQPPTERTALRMRIAPSRKSTIPYCSVRAHCVACACRSSPSSSPKRPLETDVDAFFFTSPPSPSPSSPVW